MAKTNTQSLIDAVVRTRLELQSAKLHDKNRTDEVKELGVGTHKGTCDRSVTITEKTRSSCDHKKLLEHLVEEGFISSQKLTHLRKAFTSETPFLAVTVKGDY